MNTKAMRWAIYLGVGIAIVHALGGCDNRTADTAAPVRPAVEAPATSGQPTKQPTQAQRDASKRARDNLYRDWPKPNLREEGGDGRS